ncbi:unnamed protein product [Parnassius apollo]|uniref:(apollo) hypothetical protein n=2 Tax=Parnassius apollo TaxID=110799 RepID=A0A8S3WBL8_PARAO|nr:unnamed protein product [Parnassius apollo]
MESNGTRKGPLPGGRQGASGAGAGRDSMRTASRARGAARPPSRSSHPSSPPAGLVSAGSSRAQQSAPATVRGVRRMRWTTQMNSNALRAYFRAKGGETGGFAYRARMHRLFAELEPSVTVTEQNLADRVRYILRSNTFDVTELERLRREAVPSSGENAAAEDAAPQLAEQTANVDAAVNTPVVVDSNYDGTVAQELELEQMRSTLEEAIVETRSTTLENRPRLPRLALSKRNRAVVRALNPMLVTYLEASRDLCETDSILFGAALAVCRIIGAKLSTAGRATGQSSAIPAWRIRIEERIAKARALIGRLICFRSGNTRPRIVRTVRMAFAGTNVSLSQPDIMQKLTERIDDLKQRIAAWGKRIRRYTERSTRFNQNRLFQSDQKRLYKSLERPIVSGTGPAPNQADTVAFWRSLWSEPVNHNEGPWTEVVASQCASITPMDPVTITPDDVAEAVRRAPNWKSPGLDGLHHYWLKGFMVCHSVLARQFQEALNQKSLPSLFTTGITHLVPKDQGATDPSKYRPITAKGEETGCLAYRARMHRLFAELEPSLIVTEQNLADRVRYILRSNIFDVAELERLRREAVPSSDENATAEDAAPQMVEQPANVDAAVNTPVVVDSNDDGTVAQELELEHMRSILEEAIVETRSTPLENRPRLPRIALSKRNRAVVRALNPMLVTYLEASRDLCETDSILFGAALAVCRIIGAKVSTAGRATGHSSAIPAWRRRIEERIAKARALIGRLICFRSGNNRPRIVRTVRMAFAGTNVSLSQPDITQKLTERIDDLKQRIAAWGKRIRRYTERSTRFNQNRLFQSDQKRLYESLERPMVSGTGPAPNQADTVAFWRGLWSEPVNHSEGPWTEVVASQCAGITPMDPVIITPDDVAEAVRRAPNWKSPGLDGLHHYWLKGFMACHSVLARQFQEALNQKSLPSLFTTGITHLVPKDQGLSPAYHIVLPLIKGKESKNGRCRKNMK